MSLKDLLFKKDEESQQLTPEQTADLKFVEAFYEEGLKARAPYEKQWYYNMAYFLDKQWLTWNNATRSIEVPLVPSWRQRITINKVKSNVLHIQAKFTKNKPAYIVLPATAEAADQHKAIVSKKVLEHLHRINLMDILNQRLTLWKIIYGTVFKEPYYNIQRGQHIRRQKTETTRRPVLDDTGIDTGEREDYERPVEVDGQPQFYDFNVGEVDTEILSPFSIIPESGATDLKGSQRVLKLVSKSLEYIRETYPAGRYVHAEDKSARSSLEGQLLRLMGEQYITTHITPEQQKKQPLGSDEGFAVIKELREKPSKRHPKGRLLKVANGVLLHSGPLPFEFMIKRQTFGIVQYDYTEVADRFWGDTPVVSMIPIQTEYNKTVSQITEIKNLMSKPKWLVYKDSKLPKTAITSEPGEVIEPKFVPGVPAPSPIQMPGIPAYVENIPQRCNKDMEDVALIHQVSKGTVPPGITSGVAIQYLQEQDQTVFGPVISRFEAKEGEAGSYELEIVKERYREPRLLKIVGQNNEMEVLDFTATDDMPTDVVVQSGSALPQSLIAKQQLILQWFEKGMLGDPNDPKIRQKALQLSEVPNAGMLYEEAVADEREVEREHKAWEHGQPTEIEFFDNHAFHSMKHLLFCKSDRYRNLIAVNPDIAQYISIHISGHDEKDPAKIMQREQEAMMKEQMALDTAIKQQEAQIKGKKAENEHAETVSKIMTDVTERKLAKPGAIPLGGTS